MKTIERIHGGYVYRRRVSVLSERLAELLPPGARVLDVGCGDGMIDRLIMQRRPDVEIVKIPEKHLPTPNVDTVTSATVDPKTGKKMAYPLRPMRVTIATLQCAKQPAKADKFAAFVASEEGNKVFREFGYMNVSSEKLWEGGKRIR